MQMLFQENQVVIWCIESPTILRKFLTELTNQVLDQKGKFVLSEQEHILDIGKYVDLLLTPFAADVNEKRNLNKIYAELKEIAFDETHYLSTKQILGEIIDYFSELEQETSVDITFDEEIDFNQLLKAAGIKIETYDGDTLSRLGQYLQVMAKLLQKKIVVFVNLSFYLEKEEIEELLKQAFYLKLHVLLIEQKEIKLDLSYKQYIIDNDNCEIF